MAEPIRLIHTGEYVRHKKDPTQVGQVRSICGDQMGLRMSGFNRMVQMVPLQDFEPCDGAILLDPEFARQIAEFVMRAKGSQPDHDFDQVVAWARMMR